MVTFPKNWLQTAGIKSGDYVTLELTPQNFILIKPLEQTLSSHKSKGVK